MVCTRDFINVNMYQVRKTLRTLPPPRTPSRTPHPLLLAKLQTLRIAPHSRNPQIPAQLAHPTRHRILQCNDLPLLIARGPKAQMVNSARQACESRP